MTKKNEEIELESNPEIDGKWGWFVVFNSFISNIIVDGMQYTFSNFLLPITDTFNTTMTSVSLIGSLLSGFYNFSGPIASGLGNKFGFRMVIITGSFISSGGLMLSYFANNLEYLYFFYGVLGGLGFGMIYMASVIMTSLYFEKYRALATSLSVCGTGVGTFIFSPAGTWLVHVVGWRFSLVIEGGVILICILCGLSFKPVDMIKVIPFSRRTSAISILSSATLGRGSIIYTAENRKTLRNERYPTFKEALQKQDTGGRQSTVLSLSGKSRAASIQISQGPVFSMIMTSNANLNPNFGNIRSRNFHTRCKKKCDICCFNFWHCRCKQKHLTLGDRPLYRDDIFYGGSLASLSKYSTAERFDYHLSVTRIPDAVELEEHASRKCCVCHQAVLRTCLTMTGFNLLSSRVFIFLCIASIMYTLSLYIPYVFIRKVAKDHEVPDDISVWMVSTIGLTNTVGRLTSGILKSFYKVNTPVFVLTCLFVSGLSSFIFIITVNLTTLFLFCCLFGFFTAPFISLRPVIIVEFLGLEKLTNAFGLVLLGQGIASIAGPPAAGALEESTGNSVTVIYLAGGLLLLSATSLTISTVLDKKTQKHNDRI